ncbi:MAG: 3-phosphoglycerate dehydrogenase [Clostridiales bacterium]|nr:3-phosphoglycerate dehydrogenase [Clostridiales bacterium]
MLRILVTDGIEKTALKRLVNMKFDVVEKHFQKIELIKEIENFDVLVVRSATIVDKDIIDAAYRTKRLKLIIRGGVGVDNIDVDYAKQKGIMVRNTPNASSASVAELVIGHIFTMARFIHCANVSMRKGEWNKNQYKGIEVCGKTLGIIGFGRIGRETAKKAKALGMKVKFYDITGPMVGNKLYKYCKLDEILTTSDFISLHVPFNCGEKAVIGQEEISKMKDGAYLINCARGGVIDENALIEALDTGKLAGAAIDVFEKEPAINPVLLSHERVSLTPHIGASTKEAQERIGDEIVDIVYDFIKGREFDGIAKSI